MKYKYSGNSLDECLIKAEKNLCLSRAEFDYRITKEEKGLFRKYYCEISIDIKEKVDTQENLEVTEEIEDKVLIEEGKLVFKEDFEEELVLDFDSNIKAVVNDLEVENYTKITSKDFVMFKSEVFSAMRELKLSLNEDNTEAKISIEYKPEIIGDISLKLVNNVLKITKKDVNGQLPPHYSKEEILLALKSKGIVYGVLNEVVEELTTYKSIKDVVIAKGLKEVDDEEDIIEVYFENSKRNVEENSEARIDYRNLYSIANVLAEDVLAEIKVGKEGNDGINIFGKPIKRKMKKPLKITAGDGCKIDGNTVVAQIEGRPTIKNGVFFVNKVLQTSSDVDLKSGNINFVGDVQISGSVKNGSTVQAGNSVQIDGNVESAKIIAQGEVRVNGSVINSNLVVGAKDLDKQTYLENLEGFLKDITMLVESVNQIKQHNLLGGGRTDGEIIKVLIETKFKSIPRRGLIIASVGKENKQLSTFIKEKIMGLKPLDIKHSNELYDLIKCIENEISPIKEQVLIPVDVRVTYTQDSKIYTTGDIYITGKGQYTSELSAKGSIEFLQVGAVSRGGTLIAGRDIKAKVIGSVAGVTTLLKVPKYGMITADVAYQNTTFCFGERQYCLETSSKDVKAFLNESGEVVVEKFVL